MKLVYCSANIYLLVYISHFLPIISRRHLKHTADKCICAWEFKKPFIFCFITLRYIQAKINEQLIKTLLQTENEGRLGFELWPRFARFFCAFALKVSAPANFAYFRIILIVHF